MTTAADENITADIIRAQNTTNDQRDAQACFQRVPRLSGCAAVWAVAPAPASSGLRTLFVELAAASSRSLKKLLPTARTVVVLGRARCGALAPPAAGRASTPPNATKEAAEDALISDALKAFDEVVRWCEPGLYSLASLYRAGAHRGWMLKPPMLAASPYKRSVFFDSDTLVEGAAVARLFALLRERTSSPPHPTPPPLTSARGRTQV